MSRSELRIEPYEDSTPEKVQALALVDEIGTLAVVDQPTLTRANDILVNIKILHRKFDEEFDGGIGKAFALHRSLVAQKKKWTDPLDAAERVIKPRIAGFLAAEDAKRLQAAREAQLAREAAAKEAEDAADVAHDLIQTGNLDEAEQVLEMQAERIEAIQAAAPAVPEKPVALGTSLVRRWTWDRDVKDLSLVPYAFLKLDEAKITRYVQNMKWDAKIPGIRIYAEDDVATRVRR